MFLYTVLTIPVAIIAGLLIALRTKKAENVTYGALDKIGRVTNIILIPLYLCFIPFTTFLGSLADPFYDGILGFLGLIVSILIGSAALFSGLGLGASVALRKKGRSAASFTVQFAGVLGLGISMGLYAATAGNLLCTLN